MADIDPNIATPSLGSSIQTGMAPNQGRELAVITGASSGIGLELARIAAREGHDLILAAYDIDDSVKAKLTSPVSGQITTITADLATADGIDRVMQAIGSRNVALLCANAGEGLGDAFLEQDFDRVRHLIETNVTGTLDLVQRVARLMREDGRGRILFTGSIAGEAPGTYQAAYGGSKAFINSFAQALRAELKDSGVSVTVLKPGATDTGLFRKAGLKGTRVDAGRKEDPASVAETGWKAMMNNDDKVISGFMNKIEGTIARFVPAPLAAKRFGYLSEPGGAGAKISPAVIVGGLGLAAGLVAFALKGRGQTPAVRGSGKIRKPRRFYR